MYKFFIGAFSGLIFGIIIGATIKSNSNVEEIREEPMMNVDSVAFRLEQPEFFLEDHPNPELVKQACEYYDIQYPDIVTAQAILETGHFRSKACKERNNLFGLFNSYTKEYFKFDHWTESVKAYYDLVQYRYKEGDYYGWLQNIGYAEDPEYIIKIKNVQNKFLKPVE